jgi:hypothetical protein
MVEMGFSRPLLLHPTHYYHQHSHQLTHTIPQLHLRNANLGLHKSRECMRFFAKVYCYCKPLLLLSFYSALFINVLYRRGGTKQCTTNPPSLQILSSTSYTTLHIISASCLAPLTHLQSHPHLSAAAPTSALFKLNTHYVSSLTNIDVDHHHHNEEGEQQEEEGEYRSSMSQPHPIYQLSHHLLMFASSPT